MKLIRFGEVGSEKPGVHIDGVNYDVTLIEGENGYNLQTQNGKIIDTLRSDIQFDEWIQTGHLTMIYDDTQEQEGGRKKYKKSKKSKKSKKAKKSKKSKKAKKSKKRSNRTRRSKV
jgi:hypothetical protein